MMTKAWIFMDFQPLLVSFTIRVPTRLGWRRHLPRLGIPALAAAGGLRGATETRLFAAFPEPFLSLQGFTRPNS